MKFTRSRYPDFTEYSSPCWTIKGRWIYFDADWNTRFPFGTCLSLRVGPYRFMDAQRKVSMPRNGICLDLNAPLGEPNRLTLSLGRWDVVLGLPSVRSTRPTGQEIDGVPVWEPCWSRPHLDGISRYRYRKDEHGNRCRNDKPEPLHWGWLTIDRRLPG